MVKELPNYYEVLGVNRDATIREIKDAYLQRLMSAFYEIQNNPKTFVTTKTLKDIVMGYDALKNVDNRKTYDDSFFKNIIFLNYEDLYSDENNCTEEENNLLKEQSYKILKYLDFALNSDHVQDYFQIPVSITDLERIMMEARNNYYTFVEEKKLNNEDLILGSKEKEDIS